MPFSMLYKLGAEIARVARNTWLHQGDRDKDSILVSAPIELSRDTVGSRHTIQLGKAIGKSKPFPERVLI